MEIRNRRFNARKKEKPETTEDIEREISANTILIDRMAAISSLKDFPGWVALKETKREELEAVEEELDGFSTLTDKGRDYALARRAEIKNLIALVDSSDALVESLTEDVNKLKIDLNERKQRARATV